MNRSQQTRGVVAALYIGAIASMFGAPLIRLFKYAQHNEVNSYLVLVPFVCAYLLWIRRGNLANPSPPAYFVGLVLTVAATFVWALALAFRPTSWMPDRADQLTVFTLSIVLYVWAGGFLFLGRRWMQSAAFPVFFLLFMVPL